MVTVATLAAAIGGVLSAQAPGTPTFEVATIKPSGPDSGAMGLQRLGNRIVTANTPLAWLISWAFDAEGERLIGMPKGADSVRFDVPAKAPDGELPPGQLQRMMQALLADRFHLVVHRERRALAGYALVLDDKGLKVPLSAATERPGPNPFSMPVAGTLTGSRVTTDMLATVLSNQLRRPVQNLTKTTGVFDFTLRWQPDSASVTDTSRPSLFTALREQLGLRLESRLMDADVVVIDRLDLVPTEN